MSGSVPLTVVVLARNEETRLEACLRSVAWAAEVLVIDDDSTDGTVALAERLGARVLRRRMDIEGRHRNWASQQARHDWVFSLDADEQVTPELAEELRALFAGAPPREHYTVPRRNYIGRQWIRYGGWYPSAQVKLFDRRVFRWEEAAVHPRAFCDTPCGQLHQDLLHYSYRDIGDFVNKLNRQTTLEAEKWVTTGRRVSFGKALWRTLDRFARSFIGKQGYRDGTWGFVVSWLAGTYQLLSYAKYVELQQRHHVVVSERSGAPEASTQRNANPSKGSTISTK